MVANRVFWSVKSGDTLKKKKKAASFCVRENVLPVDKSNGLSWFLVMAPLLLYCPMVSFCLTEN